MNEYLISVIVPIYNVEKYLKRCVYSIMNQTYRNLEIILVDDGSLDDSSSICDCFAEKDNRIRVIHKENGGLSDARNAGMKIATGNYISFIDSDDWIEQCMFEDMVKVIIKDNTDIVSCGVRWVTEIGEIIREDFVPTPVLLDRYEGMKELLSDGALKQHVWNKLYKANLIKNIPFEKGKYHEDVFWSYQIFGISTRVSIVPKIYYNYVQRSNSIMGEKYSAKRLDALDGMQLRCEYIKKNFPNLYDLSLYMYIGNCMFHLQSAYKTNCDKKIIDNIIKRLEYKKTGNIFTCIKGKQVVWLHLFLMFPKLTCKIRNTLKVGI